MSTSITININKSLLCNLHNVYCPLTTGNIHADLTKLTIVYCVYNYYKLCKLEKKPKTLLQIIKHKHKQKTY